MTGWRTFKVACVYSPMPVDIRAPNHKVAAERFALGYLSDWPTDGTEPEDVFVRLPKETKYTKFLVTIRMVAEAVASA